MTLPPPTRFPKCRCWSPCAECSERERAEMEFYAPLLDPSVEAEFAPEKRRPEDYDHPFDSYDPAEAREQMTRALEDDSFRSVADFPGAV